MKGENKMLYNVTLVYVDYNTNTHNKMIATVYANDKIEAMQIAMREYPKASYTYSVRESEGQII